MYDDLTQYALDGIVERIVQNEVITGTAEYRIWKLQQIGIHLEKIKAYIKQMTKYSDEEIENIFKNAGFTLYRPITKLFIEQNTNAKGVTYIETSSIIDFERKNSTRVEIARSDKGKRYAYFVLGEKKQLVSVAKSLTIEEEKNKELLAISSCRDKENKPFWLIHRRNGDNVADTLTKPVVSSTLQVDIDVLNAELESLLNM